MPVPEMIVEAVALENTKVGGGGPAFYGNIQLGNATSHQQRLQILAETALARSIEVLQTMDLTQSIAAVKATTGNDPASQAMALLAGISAGNQLAKGAVNTPPAVIASGP